MMNKREHVIAMLIREWTPTYKLGRVTGWKPHTIRALISTEAKKRGLTIERKRENGITSYRATKKEAPPA
jgi:hypothetical protein